MPPDLIQWTIASPAVSALPSWVPNPSFWNERWHVYYALSSFGSNWSAIGLFTSPILDPKQPDYGWRDNLQEQNRFWGAGHDGFMHDANGQDYIVYHVCDKTNQRRLRFVSVANAGRQAGCRKQ